MIGQSPIVRTNNDRVNIFETITERTMIRAYVVVEQTEPDDPSVSASTKLS